MTGTLVVEKPFVDLRYEVRCDERWRTRAATARMRADADQREVDLAADAEGRWRRDGSEIDALRGCADVDLQLTPATNTLPIRRLDLALGAEAEVNAAWLRFPALDLVPLRQRYARIGPRTGRTAPADPAQDPRHLSWPDRAGQRRADRTKRWCPADRLRRPACPTEGDQ